MNKVDIVRETFRFGNQEASAANLADNFQATDAVGGQPLDKASWMGMGQMMEGSFPDIEFVIEEISEEGDDVKVVGHFTGTFTNDFDLTPLGMSVIPATGKTIRWPSDTSIVSFEGDKIVRSHSTDTGPDAGLAGFLRALGADAG